MTDDEKNLNEDVAAKLMGKVKCPACRGTGIFWPYWEGSSDPDDQEIAELEPEEDWEECKACNGQRWIEKDKLIGYQG